MDNELGNKQERRWRRQEPAKCNLEVFKGRSPRARPRVTFSRAQWGVEGGGGLNWGKDDHDDDDDDDRDDAKGEGGGVGSGEKMVMMTTIMMKIVMMLGGGRP